MSDDQAALDALDPDLECGAWTRAPHVIGTRGHHHICREPDDHRATDDTDHQCTCGHTW